MRRARPDQALLITTAPESSEEEYTRRKRRYAIMMGLRVVCVIAAATTYHVSILLALAFVVGGAVLPWCAVLIANDGPPRRRVPGIAHGGGSGERALSGETDRTVDG